MTQNQILQFEGIVFYLAILAKIKATGVCQNPRSIIYFCLAMPWKTEEFSSIFLSVDEIYHTDTSSHLCLYVK